MQRILLFFIAMLCGIQSSFAQDDTRLEAEDAIYANCSLVRDSKYSGGKALELTEENAIISL